MVIYKFKKSDTNTSVSKKQTESGKDKNSKKSKKQDNLFEMMIDFIFNIDLTTIMVIVFIIMAALLIFGILRTDLEKHTDYTVIDEVVIDSENQDVMFSAEALIFNPKYAYDLYIGNDLIAEDVESYWPAYELSSLSPGQSETYNVKVKVRYVWLDANEDCGEYNMKVTINK